MPEREHYLTGYEMGLYRLLSEKDQTFALIELPGGQPPLDVDEITALSQDWHEQLSLHPGLPTPMYLFAVLQHQIDVGLLHFPTRPMH